MLWVHRVSTVYLCKTEPVNDCSLILLLLWLLNTPFWHFSDSYCQVVLGLENSSYNNTIPLSLIITNPNTSANISLSGTVHFVDLPSKPVSCVFLGEGVRGRPWTYPSPGTHWTSWRRQCWSGGSYAASLEVCRCHTVQRIRLHHCRPFCNSDHTSSLASWQLFCSNSSWTSWKTPHLYINAKSAMLKLDINAPPPA